MARVAYFATQWSEDCHSSSTRPYEEYTDSSGRYDLTAPAFGYPLVVLHLNQSLFPRPELISPDTIQAGEHHLDHQFRSYRIRGRVLGPDSLPLRQGFLTYYQYYPGMFCGTGLPEATITDGAFDVRVQPYPDYVFWTRMSLASYDTYPSLHPRIPIHGDTTITLTFGGFAVSGVARGYAGRPLANGAIYASGTQASAQSATDSVGRFNLFLPKGNYRWSALGTGPEYQEIAQLGQLEVSGPRQVDWALDYVQWSGRVGEEGPGDPLDSIRVSVEESGPHAGRGATSLTDRDGRFRVFVRRGAKLDIDAVDLRTEGHPVNLQEDYREAWARLEREFARVHRWKVSNVTASRDSSFEILMEPIRK